MAFDFGQVTLYRDAATRIDPIIEDLGAAVPSKTFTGVVYQMMGGLMAPLKDPEYRVYSRSKSTRNGAIAAAWTATATTGLAMPAQHCNGLTIGHVISIGGEIVIVKGVNRAAGTIDVFGRGLSGTTAAAHPADTPFMVTAHAGRDEDLKKVESVSEHSITCDNYAQMVFETVDFLKYANLPNRQGLAAGSQLMATERIEAATRMSERLSAMAIHSVKHKGTQEMPYMTSGLLASLADTAGGARPIKAYAANGPITETKLTDALDDVFEYGSPDSIVLSVANARRFKSFVNAGDEGVSIKVEAPRADHGAGRYVTHYDYNGSLLRLLIDRDMPNDRIAIVTAADLKKGWLETDPLTLKVEPTQSTREYRESLQGSIGFLVENVGYSHILITGVTV